MRRMVATVPTRYRSSASGSSSVESFCTTRKMCRSRASASFTALMEISRPTNNGIIM